MSRRPRLLTALTGFTCLLLGAANPAASESEGGIRPVITAEKHPALRWTNLDDVQPDLVRVYDATADTPIWVNDGRPTEQAQAVIQAMAASDRRGLDPADYETGALKQLADALQASPGDIDAISRFDTAMTVALLRMLRHSEHGRVDPRRFGFGLDSEQEPVDLQPIVLDIAGSSDPAAEIAAVDPPFPLFQRLLVELAHYRGLAQRTDIPEMPEIPTLHEGETSPATPALRARLLVLGDLTPEASLPADPSVYEGALVEAVKHFQKRHGLEADGVIGQATLRALRYPITERASQIEVAIERLRWLPRKIPDRFLIVNIPEFRLLGFDRGAEGPVLSSEVVVGSAARKHETPILHSEMQYLVFRPYWNVPPTIARNELRPKSQADAGYLPRNNMEEVDGRIRQRPGPNNSLGLVKFIFPNRHHVYLHDTPAKALFGRSRRDFSHGCIRVAKPADLAEFVLRGQGNWDKDRIVAAMQKGRDNQHVRLENPVAVYLLYSTVIIGRNGELRFFEDIYGHDADLRKTLAKGPPYS